METQQGWRQELARLGCLWVRGAWANEHLWVKAREGSIRARDGHIGVGMGWGGKALVLLCHKPYSPLSFPGPFATPLEQTHLRNSFFVDCLFLLFYF